MGDRASAKVNQHGCGYCDSFVMAAVDHTNCHGYDVIKQNQDEITEQLALQVHPLQPPSPHDPIHSLQQKGEGGEGEGLGEAVSMGASGEAVVVAMGGGGGVRAAGGGALPVTAEVLLGGGGVTTVIGGGGGKWLGKGGQWWALMALSSTALVVGLSVATILGRLYFERGGNRRWLYTWIQCAAWPLLLPPLAMMYKTGAAPLPSWRNRKNNKSQMLRLLLIFAGMGWLTALDNLLYSWGTSYVPVSTNSLLSASQLAFNAVFSAALVRQKMTALSLNAVVVITVATLLLAFAPEEGGGGSGRPEGTSKAEYGLGMASTVAASAVFALLLPLTELIYRKVVGRGTFARVLEVQIGVAAAASAVAAVGMTAAGDWAAMQKEAEDFGAGGKVGYAVTLAVCGIGWQMYVVGGAGVIFLASSLMSCVFMTAMIPLLPLLAVIVFHDAFSAIKGLAMLLSLWGFLSYLYGAYLRHASSSLSTLKISDTPPSPFPLLPPSSDSAAPKN